MHQCLSIRLSMRRLCINQRPTERHNRNACRYDPYVLCVCMKARRSVCVSLRVCVCVCVCGMERCSSPPLQRSYPPPFLVFRQSHDTCWVNNACYINTLPGIRQGRESGLFFLFLTVVVYACAHHVSFISPHACIARTVPVCMCGTLRYACVCARKAHTHAYACVLYVHLYIHMRA